MGFSRQEYWSGIAVSFSSRFSWPRDQTRVSRIAGQKLYPLSHQGSPQLKSFSDSLIVSKEHETISYTYNQGYKLLLLN